jgi:hypothetical protein
MRLQQLARPLVGALLIAAFGLPIAVQAQPSYARHDESIRGRITSFDGRYELRVRDERGYVDRVTLHDGTIIHPVGLRLASGLSVLVRGRNDGATFVAYEIDAPYTIAPPAYTYPAYAPYPAYPPYGYPEYVPYSYPYYHYYPYYRYHGPYYPASLSVNIGFGGPGYYGHVRYRH